MAEHRSSRPRSRRIPRASSDFPGTSRGHPGDEMEVSVERADTLKWEPTWKDIVLASAGGVSLISLIVWCILFYNWAGLEWLLYLGWAFFASGIVVVIMNRFALKRKGRATKGGGWLQTTVVVDSGIYAVVRHPMYLGFMLIVLSLMLISQHWLSPVFGVPWIVFLYSATRGEEKLDTEKFGDDYRLYMQSVPGFNLPVGVVRLLRRRKGGD